MRRAGLTAVAVTVASALTLAASSRPAPHAVEIPSARAASGNVLGVFWRQSSSDPDKGDWLLARVDPRSLQPRRRGPRVRLAGSVDGWSFAPDGSRLAVTVRQPVGAWDSKAYIRLFDSASLRLGRKIGIGSGWTYLTAWLAPDRLLVLQGSRLVVVNPLTGEVVREAALDGTLVRAKPLRDAVVLLLRRGTGVGPAMLGILDAEGRLRTAELPQTYAGWEQLEPEPEGRRRYEAPALAVDAVGRRAFVIGGGEPIAEVSLDSLTLRYHSLAQPRSLLGRLRDWLEPAAQAKVQPEGSSRHAQWLGDGLIALSGSDTTTYRDRTGQLQALRRPIGLNVIDTRDWSARMLDAGADWFTRYGSNLLATGSTSDSARQDNSGIGLVSFAPDGSRRFEALKGHAAWVELVFRNCAYVRFNDVPFSRLQVVDLRTGRVIGTRKAQLPWLINGPSSVPAD